jgi:hypothetical protein
MELGNERVPAVGGDRLIPAPDPIARDYLLLALRLDKLLPGLVDEYIGPADIPAQVAAEEPLAAGRLREQASSMLSRLQTEALEADRGRWLRAQLVSLEAQAMALAGDPLPYADCAACFFDITAERASEAVFDAAADDLARLLPPGEGGETISERLSAWESRFAVDPDRLPAVADWVMGETRERADRLFGLPTGEGIDSVYISGEPWTVSSRYEGGCRTVLHVNTDMLRTPSDIIHMAAQEGYPGRHTERAWRERRLIDDMGRLEASVFLLNTPEALISAGLSHLGERMVASDEQMHAMLLEIYARAGLAIAADPGAASDAAETQVRIRRAIGNLRAVTANAAFMLHADGVPRAEVAVYLRRRLLTTRERAEVQLGLIEDPVYRTQVLAAYQGERLLFRWFELGPASERVDRFGRFMREQLTPGSLARELSSINFGEMPW